MNQPEFKLIVAGSRGFTDADRLWNVLNHLANTTYDEFDVSIVSGMARGADRLAWEFAKDNGVVCHEFPAKWNQYPRRAGFMRNEQMAQFSDGLLAFWDGKSPGTKHMIETMQRMGKPVHIERY